jgi:hypothetical protein
MPQFKIHGIITIAETGKPASGLFVKAYDKDLVYDDLMGSAHTDAHGRFEISTEAKDFRDLFEVQPEVYLQIYTADGQTLLHTTEQAIWLEADKIEPFEVRLSSRGDVESSGCGQPDQERPHTFQIRLKNNVHIAKDVPSLWMSVYLVADGEFVQEFPVELAELARGRTLERPLKFDTKQFEGEKGRRSWHLFLDRPSKQGDAPRVGGGIFLRRSDDLPTGVVLTSSQILRLAANRAKRVETPTARDLTKTDQLDAALRKWKRSSKDITELSPEIVAPHLMRMED